MILIISPRLRARIGLPKDQVLKLSDLPQEKVTLNSDPLSSATKQEHDRRVFMMYGAFQKSEVSLMG